MTETGNPAEYAAEIPSAGGETLVSYYITVADTDNKVYTSPGEAPEFFYQFAVATDTIAPTLLHQPLNIVFTDDPIARIVATGADNIGLNPMLLTYRINGGSPVNLEVTPATESKDGYYIAEYYYEWDLGALGVNKGDVVEYKLSVTDVSGSAFEAIHPSEDIGFNEILIDELNPAVSLYANDFNSADGDFVGVGFEIGSVTGFSSGILHSDHPYRELPGSSSEDTLILYQLLKTPIKISEFDPSITFEEVVLVEPGEDGSVFGDDDFWDYVVVEGSRDYGVTWQPFTDGYDCGAYADWKTHYNSDLVTKTFTSPDGSTNYPDSEAEGTETLFKFRQIDMLENGTFEAGEEVLIRFKIYADQLAAGWGWAIDNLKIQIDDEAPLIAHIATDYLPVGATELTIFSKISDNVILDSVTFELELDGNTEIIGVDEEADLYELTLPFSSPLTADSELKYRIIAVDSAANPNTTYLPETGFFEIPIAVLGEVKTSYENDFNTASTDFYGANFDIGDESGFDDPAIHSLHPYSNSPEGTSTMSYLLKYPIQTNTGAAWMSFDEVVLVNPFGDGVTVQVSNDNGANWYNVLTQYGSNSDIDWNTTYLSFDVNGNSIGEGSSLLYKNRLVNLLDPAEINGGDEILVRFTLSVNDRLYAWGWAIDNLEIQGITTAIEDNEAVNLSLYPNPTQGKQFVVKASGLGMETTIVIRDMLGKSVLAEKINPIGGSISREYNLEAVKPGLYLVSVDTPSGIETTRLILR